MNENSDSCLVHPELPRVIDKIIEVVRGLVEHGFGEATIRISIQKGNKRTIVIESGKSYQYTVHFSELQN